MFGQRFLFVLLKGKMGPGGVCEITEEAHWDIILRLCAFLKYLQLEKLCS